MAVSIMTPQERESGFDKFLRRLGGVASVANSGINAYAGIKDIQAKGAAQEAAKLKAENDAQGIYGLKEIDPKDWMDAKQGEDGAQLFKVKGGDGNIQEVFKRRYLAPEKAKSPEELALLKSQTAKNYAESGKLKNEANSSKAAWDQVAKPDQEIATDLSRKNASKVAIKNQIDAVMKNWDDLPDDQKVTQGRQLIKVLNSTEGADAVGSEEAKRLGGKLEFAFGNLTNSNPFQVGRDLSGFKEQANLTAQGLGSAIQANQDIVRRVAGPASGRGLADLVKEKKQELPKSPDAFAKMSDDELLKLYNAKKSQKQTMRAR